MQSSRNSPNQSQLDHIQRERTALYSEMNQFNMTPLWEVLHALVPTQPTTPCVPAIWRYADVRPFLMRAGEVITAEQAVRRVLILENPALRGQSAITQSLYAGLQLILPNEVAPAHRHTQSALRFIVEGSGAFTAVDGQRTTMTPGDFIITPSWTWHDHGSDAQGPVVWLDGLDIPTVRFFDAGFAENASATQQSIEQPEGLNFATYGYNMAPVSHTRPFGASSPIFSYPYSRTREALDQIERHQAIDPCDGVKLRYINPQTGGAPMPTIATFMQRLPAGFNGQGWRQTDGAIYSVVEGDVDVIVTNPKGEQLTLQAGPRDHFVIPAWHTAQLSSRAGSVVFSFSDRPIHQALNIHREERFV